MRNISNEVIEYLRNGEQFMYCFEIINVDKMIYLTSYDVAIDIDNITYLPNSGLKILSAAFNDSAFDTMFIEGIFEEGGVTRSDNINGNEIKVSLYFPKFKTSFLLWNYTVDKINSSGSLFSLHLTSVTEKLNKSLLNYFGAKCRANFGDEKCGIDKKLYSPNTNCDKNFRTCCNKFNNAVNFRGEPFIPNGC